MSYQDRRDQDHRENAELEGALGELEATFEPSAEWKVVLSLLRGGWPGRPTRAEEFAYYTFLQDIEPRQIAKGLRRLVQEGQKFRPTPAEVRVALTKSDHDPVEVVPPFDVAWSLIVDAGMDSRFRERQAMEILERLSRPVWAWAQVRGLGVLWRLPTEDPDNGRHVLRDLAVSYNQFTEAWSQPERRERLAMKREPGHLKQLAYGEAAKQIGGGEDD